MKKIILSAIMLAALTACGEQATMQTATETTDSETEVQLISEQDAKDAALDLIGEDAEIMGIRFDEPDTQWDVFVKSGERAFEVEIDATNGNVVTSEEETLAEIEAELSGDLSHEGVDGDTDN